MRKAVKNAGKGLSTIGVIVKEGVSAVKPVTLIAKAKGSWAEGKERRADAKAADFVIALDTINATAAPVGPKSPTRVKVAAAVDAKPRRGLGKVAVGLRKGSEAAKAHVRALAAALPKKEGKKGAKMPLTPAPAAATPVPSPSKLAILASPAAAFYDDEPASPSFSIPAVRPAAARALAF
jgi:hypothetical protein